ncbi:two pore domain potassium channel family protein [Rhodobacteraceae bacterium B1Z28]|uniref:Two pore domain potassium channel family protein n=1 Tax=Ruegeria haliotis TaxID=2747601 RepID=A0ABX2PPS9_9RHOB|nr:potassium channel family protein [Ruegeria haliotis]NVO56127.1 two pore domain potassium channel family protein [Ruegeria haliotis]
MSREPRTLEEWKSTLVAALGLVIASFLAWYGLSRLSEAAAGDTIGTIAAVGLVIWIVSQSWFYMTQVKSPRRLLFLMGVSFIQVVPFLFAAVYGAFGYQDLCVLGAQGPADALYFSYVTFTTVGYGDLSPVGLCRALAAAEAVTGYILLGLFVAAAVTIYSHTHNRS